MPCCGWLNAAFTSTERRTRGTCIVKWCPGTREPPLPIKPSSDSPRWNVRSGKDCHADRDFQGTLVAPGDDAVDGRFRSEVVQEAETDRAADCDRRVGRKFARCSGGGCGQPGARS